MFAPWMSETSSIMVPSSWVERSSAPSFQGDEVHVWVWALSSVRHNGQGDMFTASLDAGERRRAERFHFEHDRRRFVLAHGNMRRILGMYLRCAPGEISFKVNAYGKPELVRTEGESPLHFNLSHSQELALLAVASKGELGVDVEAIRFIGREIASETFSPDEASALSLLHEEAWLESFYRCWTCKEALVKAEGQGLSIPLQAFDVSVLPDQPLGLLATRPPALFRHLWMLHALSVPDGYAAALATHPGIRKVHCFRLANAAEADR